MGPSAYRRNALIPSCEEANCFRSADRGAAGAVRGAARRRPGHHLWGGRQRRALPPCRRHQHLEPHAAGAPAPARGVPPAPRRLPRPPTDPGCRCL